jgi:hypothetical protein
VCVCVSVCGNKLSNILLHNSVMLLIKIIKIKIFI